MTDLQIGPEIPTSFYDSERTPAVSPSVTSSSAVDTRWSVAVAEKSSPAMVMSLRGSHVP